MVENITMLQMSNFVMDSTILPLWLSSEVYEFSRYIKQYSVSSVGMPSCFLALSLCALALISSSQNMMIKCLHYRLTWWMKLWSEGVPEGYLLHFVRFVHCKASGSACLTALSFNKIYITCMPWIALHTFAENSSIIHVWQQTRTVRDYVRRFQNHQVLSLWYCVCVCSQCK